VQEINPELLSVELQHKLGAFLSCRIAKITEAWLAAVRADPRLTTSDRLPEPLLKDHVPKLLQSLSAYLETGANPDALAAKKDARDHGAQRWGQRYSLRELLLEIYWLRTVLFSEMVGFAEKEFGGPKIYAAACSLLDGFLNDLESCSVAEYVEESEASLRASTDARLRLVRTVSHELRNMLNAVGLASDLLECMDDAALMRARETLQRNSGHMKELLDDLLTLSINLSRSATVKAGPVNISTLVAMVTSVYRPLAEAKSLRFSSSVKGSLSGVFSDELKIRQIMINLVSNAVKYTSKGEVHFNAQKLDDDRFAIVVQDTGVGIAEEDRKHIFSEFYQVKQESPLRGNGLGLAIVATLVDLLHGSVELESKNGEGSTFRVCLPRRHHSKEKPT
jgi:signal transduction histidine kinase